MGTAPPRLSVVVPVSRGPERVEALIRSLERQTVGPDELELILVADDEARYSSDALTVRTLRGPSRHPCVKRNHGAAAARSDKLAFVDDDVKLDAGWAEAALAALSTADAVTGPSDLPYDDSPAQARANAAVCSPLFSFKTAMTSRRRGPVRFWGVSLCNAAMRRSVFDAVGGFNETAYYWVDDAEFFHLAERLGFSIVNEPAMRCAHLKREGRELVRHYFRQRFYAGMSVWSFPELYLPQRGVLLAIALLPAAPALPLGLAAAWALGGKELAAGVGASLIGFWLGLSAGPIRRLLDPAPAAYRRWRRRDRARPFSGQEIVSSPRARLRRLVPYRTWLPGAFPQWLIWFATARCNARCPMCFYLDEIETARPAAELTLAELARTARSLPKITYLSVSGGEPFLREDLVACVQALVDAGEPAYVSLPTNGSRPEAAERAIDELTRRNPHVAFDLHLSLDGPAEVHDALRGRGSHARALETRARVSRLAERRENAAVKIVVTCSRQTERGLERFLETLVFELGCDRVNLQPLHGALRDGALKVPTARYLEASRALYAMMDRRGYRSVRHRLFAALRRAMDARVEGLLADGPLGRLCGAGRKIAVLDPYGKVLPCEPLARPIGDLRKAGYDLPGILAGPAMATFEKDRPACHCDWGCAIGGALAQSPSFYPAVARELARGLVA